MRQRACEEYAVAYKKFEQNQFDEATSISLAREMLEANVQNV